jgi:hypothetical protein
VKCLSNQHATVHQVKKTSDFNMVQLVQYKLD